MRSFLISSFSTATKIYDENGTTWLEKCTLGDNNVWNFGITEKSCDIIWEKGEIHEVVVSPTEVALNWRGLVVGEGDELYHSQYRNEEGSQIVFLPKNTVEVYDLQESHRTFKYFQKPIDDKTILCRIKLSS